MSLNKGENKGESKGESGKVGEDGEEKREGLKEEGGGKVGGEGEAEETSEEKETGERDCTKEEEKDKPAATMMGWCSWCLQYTLASLKQKNTFQRDIYECSKCGGDVSKCVFCKEGLARNMAKERRKKGEEIEQHNKLCAECNGMIPGACVTCSFFQNNFLVYF